MFKKDPTAKGIANSFIGLAEFLKMYSNYCSNQDNSFSVINKLKEKKDKKFESFLQYCFARPECLGLDFNAYMIKPIQRICKYPLLIRELINKTEKHHEDYQKLQEASDKIEGIVGTINERKRESELTQKTYELSKTVIGIDVRTIPFFDITGVPHDHSNSKIHPGRRIAALRIEWKVKAWLLFPFQRSLPLHKEERQ